MYGNGNCDVDNEKTIVTSSKWTQCEIDDHKVSMASSTGGNRVMEKPGQELLQQQQQALRCPRCDSSNTKFCYYNNYSLTQPRHFCKACKRYWTRGGTLRNVPVGGGCRKNKRLKRPTYSCSNNNIDSSASPSSSNPSSVVANPNPPSQSQQQQQQQQQQHNSFDIAATSNHINTMLYGGNNSCHDVMNFPFSTRFNSTRVSNPVSGFDNLHQNGLGLGFSSGILMSAGVVGGGGEVNLNHHHHQHHQDEGSYRNGFSTSNNNNYSSIFGSTSTSSTPVMASLLSSTLLQQKFMSTGGGIKGGGGGDDPFHHHHEMDSKEVKLGEGLQNRLDQWNMNNLNGNGGAAFQNQMENMGLSDNNSSLYWNNNHNSSSNNNTAAATGLGSVWSTDQPGSNSVTSLI